MKKIILLASFIAGILFFCIYQEWLMVYWNRPSLTHEQSDNMHKKESVVLTFFKDDQWIKKHATIMYEHNETAHFTAIVNAWLATAYDQQLIFKKIMVKNMQIDLLKKEGVLSFSDNFFDQEATGKEQLFLIETLLKTLQDNKISCKQILFLVNNQPVDSHFFDFSLPWPLQGFLPF